MSEQQPEALAFAAKARTHADFIEGATGGGTTLQQHRHWFQCVEDVRKLADIVEAQAAELSRLQAAGGQGVEIWKPVRGAEGLYEVSSAGDVRRVGGDLLAKNRAGFGYFSARISINGSSEQRPIHRLVAEAFLGDVEGLEVNHLNGIRTDNRVENLEITTRSGNEIHSRYQLLNLIKPVCAYDSEGKKVAEYPSVAAVAEGGYCPKQVSKCCLGKHRIHKGLGWAFKDPSHAFISKVVNKPSYVAAPAVDKAHLFDLEYAHDVLHKLAGITPEKAGEWGEIRAAMNGLRYIIDRTKSAPVNPPAAPAQWCADCDRKQCTGPCSRKTAAHALNLSCKSVQKRLAQQWGYAPAAPALVPLSDMDRAVLRMPLDMALGDAMGRMQFYQRVQSLLDRIDGNGLTVGGDGGAN